MAAAAASTAVVGPMAAWQLSDSTPSSDNGLLGEGQLREGLLRRWPTAVCEPASPQDKRGFAELMRDYEVSGKQLGDGAYSVVMRGRCRKTGEPVAIKMVPKALDDDAADYKRVQADDEVRREVEMLKRVSMHSCISKFEAYYESKTHHYIVSELVTGGELFDHLAEIGSYSEKQAAALLQELGGAVALMHAQGLCHADIKPENILLTGEGKLKLVDFGLATKAGVKSEVRPGTWAYWPPEAWDVGWGGSLPADMWAVGAILYVVLAGCHPFDPAGNATAEEMGNAIRTGEPSFEGEEWATASHGAVELVKGLLRKDPECRLTVEELLQHPWLKTASPTAHRPVGGAQFSRSTARLRTAAFATILQQQAEEAALPARPPGGAKLKRQHSSLRGPMLESDVLVRAFHEFDREEKGYITEADLQRVLSQKLGAAKLAHGDAAAILQGAASSDVDGRRVMYGSFVRLMGETVKQLLRPGEHVFKRGEPVNFFYLLLSGEVEVVDAQGAVVSTLRAGEYFGENALLERRKQRNSSLRCKSTCEVLKLSADDFEAGLPEARAALGGSGGGGVGGGGGDRGDGGTAAAEARLLAFIQMVSPKTTRVLAEGEPVIVEGEAVEPAFNILSRGKLRVSKGGAPLGEVAQGECFGEMSLLVPEPAKTKQFTLTCASEACSVVTVSGADFRRLLEKSRVVNRSMHVIADRRRQHNAESQKGAADKT